MNIVYVKIHSDLRKEGQIYQVSDEVEQEVEILRMGKYVYMPLVTKVCLVGKRKKKQNQM